VKERIYDRIRRIHVKATRLMSTWPA